MVISYVYLVLVGLSLVFGAVSGTAGAVSAAAMEGAEKGIKLALELAGPMCLWCGVGELMEHSGLGAGLTKLISPVLSRLFPRAMKDGEGSFALSANVTANLLGLGNAATPMGIRAAIAMGDGSGIATAEQCRLVVMNTASIQLLPTTVAAVRGSVGCGTPMDILPCVLLTSLCSVSVGLGAAFFFERLWRHE